MSSGKREGVIVRSSGGFYTVELDTGAPDSRILECRARGIFRKEGLKPCVGDRVTVSPNEDGTGSVDEVLPRKNGLVRPPLCNLDAMVVVLSVSDPAPNLFVTDKLIAVLEHKNIEPVVAVTKTDLGDAEPLASVYRLAGFQVFTICSETGPGIPAATDVAALKQTLAGRLSAFSGNSGVGKTSLLNAIDPRLGLEVGETSRKLGRGRHTTRTIEIFTLDNGGRVADTPGFSTVDLIQMSGIDKESLPHCFREFESFTRGCRFDDCTHTVEAGCGVLKAAADGEIAESRHQSYLQMFNQIKDIKEWERRN